MLMKLGAAGICCELYKNVYCSMCILLQDDQPTPWSSTDEKDCMGITLHCIKNCTRPL